MNLCIKCENETVREMYSSHGFFFEGDSGLDLFFIEDQLIPKGSTVLVDLGIACEMKEKNTVFRVGKTDFFTNKSYFIMPRSSIYKTPIRLANSIGLIDAAYRGNLKVALDNFSSEDYTITKGQRLFQVVSASLDPFSIILTDTLSQSKRGTGGFGSTNISAVLNSPPIVINSIPINNGVLPISFTKQNDNPHDLW